MFLKSNNILEYVGTNYGNKIIKFNKVNFKKRVRGGDGYEPGVSIPGPRPRTKNSHFPHTCTQLNRLFPVKFRAGAAGSVRGRILLPCPVPNTKYSI